ncbi:MAG: DUF2569 family protein [Woeseiaceae bacterium]|nr:DUF2569 family protein [Woeseiaceae bacterium]
MIGAPSIAFAQEADPTAAARGLMPFILAAMIAYVTRRMPIGGWLFYFYLGLIFSPVLAIVLAYPVIGDYFQPSLWYDLRTYWLSFLSYIPWLASLIAVFLASIRLIVPSQRNRGNAMFLRYSLLALVIISIVGLVIEIVYFPDDAILSVISAISASIMCLYFFVSRRVKYVFDNWSGSWDYDDFTASISAQQSKT